MSTGIALGLGFILGMAAFALLLHLGKSLEQILDRIDWERWM